MPDIQKKNPEKFKGKEKAKDKEFFLSRVHGELGQMEVAAEPITVPEQKPHFEMNYEAGGLDDS